MSNPADPDWRGAAAIGAQPLDEAALARAAGLVRRVREVNCGPSGNPRLDRIAYRNSTDDQDTRRRVFRWNRTPYEDVFTHGFRARSQGNTPNATYYNLDRYVHQAGRPLDPNRAVTSAFISTTNSSVWKPRPKLQEGESMRVYRYEIHAPGGIDVNRTLDPYRFVAQDEVCFIGAIAPQYVRSAQLYQITRPRGSMHPTCVRADDRLILNGNFNPNPYRQLQLRSPTVDYIYKDGNSKRKKLKRLVILKPRDHEREERPDNVREKRQVSDAMDDWYGDLVEDIESYINAAFRARSTNEAYLFMNDEYVLVNYAPGSTDDRIINGPLLICDGYPSLVGTAFGEYGIDCAFDTDATEAFVFSSELCAYIDYAPGSTNDKILQGPMTITTMFPFFKGTAFENGIDAAFRATASNEAYLFKGNLYALINYNSKSLMAIRAINAGFRGLRGTIFERGIDAAFASHRTDEAYIFKDDQYALINFAPGSTNDYIIGGVKKIVDHWPSLRAMLPRKNHGLDEYGHLDQDQDHYDRAHRHNEL